MPRLRGSSSSMISIACTLGAPDSVPAGKVARSTSRLLMPSRSVPSTELTICCTCEYFSITILSVTLTEPVSAMRPISLRARSISITCSAISLGSFSSSVASWASFSGVLPRGRVPASGRMVTMCSLRVSPLVPTLRSSWRTRISGEAPTTWKSPKL
ncbi:hypothetical protein D3C81_1520570 [compost metagenome]